MVQRLTQQSSLEDVLSLLHPLVRTWFQGKFSTLTEPQAYAIGPIHARRNVLVSSPTGSGKTLTAFLSILSELMALQQRGKLEDRVYCVYISPLRALANDINRNLEEPLREMRALAEKEGRDPPAVRVALRHGDTSAQERQRQARRPPHIFITTPESLAIALSAPKFRNSFDGVRWVIVDEIHEVCSSKRGTLLALTLERLQELVPEEFVRIGLSATIAPIDEVAAFLAGYDRRGRQRPMHVVEVEGRKGLDLRILCPVKDMTRLHYEAVTSRMYDLLKDLIDEHRTTLIFTNTRSGTESVSFKLKERGVENLEAHHGSLSKETRLDVEQKLKQGELKAAVSSTSLELGIDIGYIDLVCQIGSPKSVAKGLQRIGRAGHAYGATSKGRLIVNEPWDLVECAALARAAYENKIDRVDIPRNSLDVLAQAIVGMSLEQRWDVDAAHALVRRAFPYHDLPREDFLSVVEYLASRNPDVRVYAKIWHDEREGRFGRRRGSRMIYYTNVGTIPEEGQYHVVNERGVPLGNLSEPFVERLSRGDVFVLGGRTYQFERARGTTVYVRDAAGRRPTVPSWTGEMLPRSFDLSMEVARFRRELAEVADREGEEGARRWLIDHFRLDEGSARTIVSFLQEQRAVVPALPTDERLVIEGYIDPKGNRNLIFHFPFGRRTNDALSRAYAYALMEQLKCNARVSITDDNFMITLPRRVDLEGVASLVRSETLVDLLKRSLRNTELFKQRFRHCATRSFMVLRNYKGREVSIGRQQLRSERVLDWLHRLERFPVITETYNEILNEVMDVAHAQEVLGGIEAGRFRVETSPFSTVPSPFAHNVILAGVSDIVTMEDRTALLKELHKAILKKVLPSEEVEAFQFTEEQVASYFRDKLPRIARREDLLVWLKRTGASSLLQEKGLHPYDRAAVPKDKVRAWALALVDEGLAASVWTPKGILWAAPDSVPHYAALYAQRGGRSAAENKILAAATRPVTAKELAKAVGMRGKPLTEAVRRLERAYALARFGGEETRWKAREVRPASAEAALDWLITTLLGIRGPLTAEELAFEAGVEEDQVRETLRDLESEGVISSGAFLPGSDAQYLVTRDLAKLRGQGAEGRRVVDERTVRAYLAHKMLRPFNSFDDYFDFFGEAAYLYDVYQRVPTLDFEDWNRRRRKGKLLLGRFVGGHVRYVRAEEADRFVSAAERPPLSKLEEDIVRFLKRAGGADFHAIAAAFPQEDRERLREAVDALDHGLHVVRRYTPHEAWVGRNIYEAASWGRKVSDARRNLLLRYAKAYGPVNRETISYASGVDILEVESLVDRLVEEGLVEVVEVSGQFGGERVVLKEEAEALEAFAGTEGDVVHILSLIDPFVNHVSSELFSRYGEGWIYAVVRGGSLVGAVEMWEVGGCVEVRQLQLEDPTLLPDVLRALARAMGYFTQRGYDVLRVVDAFGKPIGDLAPAERRPFLDAGFVRVGELLAKGDIVSKAVPRAAAFAYVLWRQGAHPQRRFATVEEALRELGGLRSDFAGALRVPGGRSLERLHRRGLVAKAVLVPDVQTFCTHEDLPLYKAAKAVPLDGPMELVLDFVREHGPVAAGTVVATLPLGTRAARSAIRKLLNGCQLAQDGQRRLWAVPDLRLTREEARRQVVERLFRAFGLFSADTLASFLRKEFRMDEVRSTLRALERDGVLVKGFLIEGDRTLYWMLREDVDRLGALGPPGTFVLSPVDHLALYLRPEVKRRWGAGWRYVVFEGTEPVAVFHATRRGSDLVVSELQGPPSARAAVRAFAEEHGLGFQEDVERVDELEAMLWYEKTSGRSGAK